MGDFDGRVAVITGAARGQGRQHAVRLAERGADIVAIDLCQDIASVGYPLATPDDLVETAELVKQAGRRCHAAQVDVRDLGALQACVEEAVGSFGRLDLVVANAGICITGSAWDMSDEAWDDVIDINLTGVWNTVKACAPPMVAGGNGGSMILISSLAGMRGIRNAVGYVSAKHGLIGLMRSLANELAEHGIRVNTVNPTNVATPMLLNDNTFKRFNPHLDAPTLEDTLPGFASLNLMPVPWVEPDDVSEAVLWLASDEARYVTGVSLPVDAGGFVRT